MSAQTTIRQLLERGEFVWAPCIYDCLSARCAELVGHNAALISSCELEYAMNGTPAGMYNWEEYIYAAERICNSTRLPIIVDGENGGGQHQYQPFDIVPGEKSGEMHDQDCDGNHIKQRK